MLISLLRIVGVSGIIAQLGETQRTTLRPRVCLSFALLHVVASLWLSQTPVQ